MTYEIILASWIDRKNNKLYYNQIPLILSNLFLHLFFLIQTLSVILNNYLQIIFGSLKRLPQSTKVASPSTGAYS